MVFIALKVLPPPIINNSVLYLLLLISLNLLIKFSKPSYDTIEPI